MRQLLLFITASAATFSALAQPMPPAVLAAKNQDWITLESLAKDGVAINAAYGDGSTALHWVSHHSNTHAANILITSGANVNAATDLGVTPLWLAAENGNSEMATLLLASGANPEVSLLSGESLVMTAATSGNDKLMHLLLEAGANPNHRATRDQTALMWAANKGHGEVVRELIKHGAEVHARSTVREQYVKSEKEQDSHPNFKYWVELGGNTALMFAARSGNLDAARYLIEAEADVNELSAFGTSPTIMAVHGGNADLLALLLDSGANVNAADNGSTVLHVAILRGDANMVKLLLSRGADVEATLDNPTPARRQSADYNFHDSLLGATALWLAARFAEPTLMQLLLDAGADPLFTNTVSYPAFRGGENVIAQEGDITVLMAAVGMGNRRLRLSWGNEDRRAGRLGQDRELFILEAVKLAAQAGVDINQVDAQGQTALDFAKARRYEKVSAFLSEY